MAMNAVTMFVRNEAASYIMLTTHLQDAALTPPPIPPSHPPVFDRPKWHVQIQCLTLFYSGMLQSYT